MSAIDTALSVAEAQIGTEVGVSNWIRVDQAMIDAFARTTHDDQWIHVDPARAAVETPFGGTIAHGFLTLSLLVPMMNSAVEKPAVQMTVNYGFDKVRFLAPVKSGKRVRGHFKLLELSEKRPGQWQQRIEITVEIEGEDKPALIAEWILQHFV